LAFCYLWRRFPADAEAAFQRCRRDRDGPLLHVLGWYLFRRDRAGAVDLWLTSGTDDAWRDAFCFATPANVERLRERERIDPNVRALREQLERGIEERQSQWPAALRAVIAAASDWELLAVGGAVLVLVLVYYFSSR